MGYLCAVPLLGLKGEADVHTGPSSGGDGVRDVCAGPLLSFDDGVRDMRAGPMSFGDGVRHVCAGSLSSDDGVRYVNAGPLSFVDGVRHVRVGPLSGGNVVRELRADHVTQSSAIVYWRSGSGNSVYHVRVISEDRTCVDYALLSASGLSASSAQGPWVGQLPPLRLYNGYG